VRQHPEEGDAEEQEADAQGEHAWDDERQHEREVAVEEDALDQQTRHEHDRPERTHDQAYPPQPTRATSCPGEGRYRPQACRDEQRGHEEQGARSL